MPFVSLKFEIHPRLFRPLPLVFTGARCLLISIGLCVVSCFDDANLSPALHPCTELPIYSAEMCFSSRTSNAAKKKVLAETLPKLFAQREDRAVNEARAGELPAVTQPFGQY
jgi:hypothetical protein